MTDTISDQTPVFRIRMAAETAQLDAFLDAMALLEPPPGSWQDVDTGETWVEAFCTSQQEADDFALQMARIAETIDCKPHAASVIQLESADSPKVEKFLSCLTRHRSRHDPPSLGGIRRSA